ncbi:MAG: transglutaminase family protein [Verrucomicrobiota bacterium]
MMLTLAVAKLIAPNRRENARSPDPFTEAELATQRQAPRETTYAALLDLNSKDVAHMGLAELNLICGSGLPGTGTADTRQSLKRLDEMAAMAKADIANPANLGRWKSNRPSGETSESIYKMRILVAVLQQKCGIHYNPELKALTTANGGKRPTSYHEWDRKFHTDASNVFLQGLLADKRQGTCVSMPVLYAAVARRLGYPVRLVMSKGHLFCRWDSPEERFNIEGTGVGGMTSYPDEFYHTFPNRLSEWELENENYLKSLTPAQELALFLKTRAVCLAQHQRHNEGLVALAQAVRLAGKRGIPGLEKQIAIDGFLPAETRHAVERLLLEEIKPFSGSSPGIIPGAGK